MPPKLLQLVMIVKNSGDDIISMLKSVKPFIDYWTILDTGSTDNTMENIKSVMNDSPGKLYNAVELFDEPFVDFSTSRNRALDLAAEKCIFTIMLDDTYHLEDGKQLRQFLKKKKHRKNGNAFYVLIEDDQRTYPSTRILRASKKLRYTHKIHECIYTNVSEVSAGKILDKESMYMTKRSRKRLGSDIELLKEEIELTSSERARRLKMHLARAHIAMRNKNLAFDVLQDIITENKSDTWDYESRILKIMMEMVPGRASSSDEINLKKLVEDYPEAPEPLFFLAQHYKTAEKLEEAFSSILKASSLDSGFSTSIENYIYQFEIPYLAADLSIMTKRLKFAEKILKTYSRKTGDPRLINMIYAISNIPQPQGHRLNAPIIVFHASNNVMGWCPGDLRGKGTAFASGSEIMVIELAKSVAKLGYRVFVFGNFFGTNDDGEAYDTRGIYSRVQYMDDSDYESFINQYIVDVLVVSRDTSKLIYRNNVRKVFLWVHDVIPWNSQCNVLLSIQYHAQKFKKMLCLCEWHKNKLKEKLGVTEDRLAITRNAILTSRFTRNPTKIPNRFIYASGVDRGLEHLLRMIAKIHGVYPDTTLHLFVDLYGINTKNNSDELQKTIDSLPYVFLHGRISQAELAHEYLKSDIWLYPTDFTETYCITALEAQASGLLCASTSLGSLNEIVGERGVVGGEHILEPGVEDDLLNKLLKVMGDSEEKYRLIKKARKWAMNQSFDNLAKEWQKEFFA